MSIIHQNTSDNLGAVPLDLIKGHLTDNKYISVTRGIPLHIPYSHPKNWYKPNGLLDTSKFQHYVAKIQNFVSGGYEVTIKPVELQKVAHAMDMERKKGKRENHDDRNENDIVTSIQRSKTKTRYLVKSMGCDRLLTLTLREGSDTYRTQEEWKALWDRFNRLLKKVDENFQYVAVLERHKKGNYHLHAAVVGRVNIKVLRQLWWSVCGGRGMGNVDIKYRQNVTIYQRRQGLAKYISKYISKQFDQTEFNKKRYWCSRHKLPDAKRIILRAEDLFHALLEVGDLFGLKKSELIETAFFFSQNTSAWFNYDEHLADDPPF